MNRVTPAPKPSLELLRSLSDEHLLRVVMEHGQLTRAEIAARSGLSKPTISESARRLTEAGVLIDTGERTTGRGRAGNYYTLAPDLGGALVAVISPEGVWAQSIDAFGNQVAEHALPLTREPGEEETSRALALVAEELAQRTPGGLRLAVVSVADPVDRATGRLVQLPDAPFMVGDLDPVGILRPLVAGEVIVDNDVNWAARAERAASAEPQDSFAYLHLGEGLGCAVVADGEVYRGHHGVSGEVAHLVTAGLYGQAISLTGVFAQLGLRRDGSTAIDVDALLASLSTQQDDGRTTLEVLADALRGVVLAAIALTDPGRVVLGGTWGRDPRVVEALNAAMADAPRSVPAVPSSDQAIPERIGAEAEALEELRISVAAARGQASAQRRQTGVQSPRTSADSASKATGRHSPEEPEYS